MKKLIILLTAVVFTVSCSTDLEDLNKNTKDPVEVSGESLFASAQKRLADLVSGSISMRLWTQHWQETTYPGSSRYSPGIGDGHWRTLYRNVLLNLKESAKVIEGVDSDITNGQKPNKLAITEILSVYAFSNLVEVFGDIPYSEALDIDNLLPKYDDGETVYLDLISRLDAALVSMNSERSFDASEDLLYAGDVESWKKFGNTLKLRMGMVLADSDPALSKQIVEEAYSAGVFQSNADDATYAYSSSAPNNNPINNSLVLSGRNDYVAGKTLVDIMNDLQDPRRANYFDPNLNENIGEVASVTEAGGVATITFTGAFTVSPVVGNSAYVDSGDPDVPALLGTIKSLVGTNSIEIEHIDQLPENGEVVFYGVYDGGPIGYQTRYADYSHTNRTMVESDAPGTILSYIEVKFLLAEAAARGYSVGTATQHYEEAIRASFENWGTGAVDDYLAKSEVDYVTAVANSTSTPAWREVIGTQAWIGLYGRGFATYLSVRRLDYPILVEPSEKWSGFPVRYPYPITEQNLNGQNYIDAGNAIGGDLPETLLFWDKEYTFGF